MTEEVKNAGSIENSKLYGIISQQKINAKLKLYISTTSDLTGRPQLRLAKHLSFSRFPVSQEIKSSGLEHS